MPGIARTVERMLDALGYQQVDVLGASLGGVIAQQLAHQAPHRVRRLVLAATGPGLGGIPGSPRALLALATPRRYHQPGHYQRIAARRDPDSPRLTLAAEPAAGPSLRGYLGQIYAISGWTSLPWLRTLRQQTLVLAGDDDPIVPAANGRILARCIPHAQLHIVRRGGHLFLLDSAAEMAGLVAAFLGGEDRRPHPAT
jgi:pimeloyl-ACP methyl ester carboxylesterase